ncbi:MAG TPA: hypothetical protein PLN27_15635 [Acidobacteriota bacterium]|nr:hypothetical protein [Acidobacteriota bacterium]
MTKPSEKKPFRIYLAGPIHGCNESQRSLWRRRVRDKWKDRFEFIDPTDQLVNPQASDDAAYEIIRQDQLAINDCDAVLANMWRESIGTAIGIVHAKREGKLVAVIDPNHIGNRIVAFYADVVCDKEDEAMRQLRALLTQQAEIRTVIKRKGRPDEPFSRETLASSIRKACQTAGREDLIVPVKVVPLVIERLLEGGRIKGGQVTTTDIKNAVWEVLADLEADPLRGEEFAGIRLAWEKYDHKEKADKLLRQLTENRPEIHLSETPYNIAVEAGKSHTTIWGVHIQTLEDIPLPARSVFQEIARVQGLARIHFSAFTWGHREDRCRVELIASKSPGIIEGKCYDNGEKGNMQSFQLVVLDALQTELIRLTLIQHLGSQGMLRLKE